MDDKARLNELWIAIRDALQAVVREHTITEKELQIAGRFFNRLGQSNMFPSLIAVALAMTSIDVTRAAGGGTRPNIEGPFHKPGAPERRDGNLLDVAPHDGAVKLHLWGRLTDSSTGKPIADGKLDFWQADQEGTYDHGGFNLCGIVRSDSEGMFFVDTIVPRDYSEHDGDPIGELFRAMGKHNRRAAHIHLKVSAPGHVPLTTQIFMPDSEYLESDYVEGAVSPDLTLSFEPRPGRPAGSTDLASRFDISLRPLASEA
ncbi:catechol 1,2-dioxygenase [soil metagenome]